MRNGFRLASSTLAIAVGAAWPEARGKAEVKGAGADGLCPGCGEEEEEEEICFRRVWPRSRRRPSAIDENAGEFYAEAPARQRMSDRFWTRGVAPRGGSSRARWK